MYNVKVVYHTVKWGEDVYSISATYNQDVHTILNYNRIRSVYVGLILKVPTDESTYSTIPSKEITRDLEYYLVRHAKKRRYYKFKM